MLGRDLTVYRLYQDLFVRSVVYLFVLDRTLSIPLPLLHQPLTVDGPSYVAASPSPSSTMCPPSCT